MARVVYNHEPEPEGSGTLYGGTEVEAGVEGETERSIAVAVVGNGERSGQWWLLVEDEEGDGSNWLG